MDPPTARPGLAKQLGVASVDAEFSDFCETPKSAATAGRTKLKDNSAMATAANILNLNFIVPPYISFMHDMFLTSMSFESTNRDSDCNSIYAALTER